MTKYFHKLSLHVKSNIFNQKIKFYTVIAALLLIGSAVITKASAAAVLGEILFGQAETELVTHIKNLRSGHAFFDNGVTSNLNFTSTLLTPRSGHTATLLDDGMVLIVGGDAGGTVEIFDPVTGISVYGTGVLNTARTGHTATKLADGRVLIAGGSNGGSPLATTEIYDPAAGVFSAAAIMNSARTGQTATALSDGRILIIGGNGAGTAEIFNPSTVSFTPTGAETINARSNHSAVLLNDGRVFIVGGEETGSAEIFEPADDTFTATGNFLAHQRTRPLLRVLPDGKVQIIGGCDDDSMEIYDPAVNAIGAHAHLIPTDDEHDALLLNDMLGAASRAALFHNGQTDELLDRENFTMTELGRRVFVAGGSNSNGQTLSSFSVLNSSAAAVTTDKLDYFPGQTAAISGTGWLAGETVDVILHEDPHTHTERRFTATADENGTFTANYLVEHHDLNITFIVGVKGQTSGRTAQTTFTDAASDPAPQAIPYSQDFSLLPYNGDGASTYPAGWQGWTLAGASSATFRTTPPADNVILNSNSTSTTTGGGAHNYNGKIGFLATSSIDPSIVLAVNTTGYEAVRIEFEIMTIRNEKSASNTRINQVDLQYRICPEFPLVCTGGFTSVSGSANGVYENNATNQTSPATTTGQKIEAKNFTLPAAADNQPNVQLRWVQRDFSGGGSRPSFAIDNISITGTTDKLNQTIDFAALDDKTYGDADFTVSASASSGLPVSFAADGNCTLSGTLVRITGAGNCAITASQTGDANYNAAPDVQQTFNIAKAAPVIVWNNPADITYGTVLDETQLNAAASTAGSFIYTPPNGAVLNAGNGQNLHVDFTPLDTANFNNASKDVSINVLKAPTVTTVNCPANVIYNGAAHEPCTVSVTGAGGLNDSLTVTYTENINAGTAFAEASFGGSQNFEPSTASAEFEIIPAVLAVTADSQTKVYGMSDPVLSYTAAGFKFSDTAASVLTGSLTRTPGEDAGSYAITQGTLAANANYTIDFTGSSLNITPAVLTVTAENQTKVLNAPDPSFAFSYSGFVGADTPGVIDTAPNCVSSAEPDSPVGSYQINCSGGLDNNYAFSYVPGTLKIIYAVDGDCFGSPGHRILDPINWDGTSVFKQKSTVPAKFRVCDANGQSIGTPGLVTSFSLVGVSSGTFATTMEETVASTTPDTAFRWSATDMQWIFNINTKSLQINKTYSYLITLNDGSTIGFQYGLK